MSAHKPVPWLRVLVEIGAIVLSILLAFAIDSWWASYQERAVEQEALASLRTDFVASRGELTAVLDIYDRVRSEFVRFERATPAELVALDSAAIGAVVTALAFGGTYDPTTSTLDALVRDGRLGLISDLELRGALAVWMRGIEDIEENAVDVRSESQRVLRAMEAHGGPFQRPGRTFGQAGRRSVIDFSVLPLADGSTLSALRQDPRLMGAARSYQHAVATYLRELNDLASIVDSLLASLGVDDPAAF